MALTFEKFSELVAGADPTHLFRTKDCPCNIAYGKFLKKAKQHFQVLPTPLNRPDYRHKVLSFVQRVLIDLAPGQHCKAAERIIAQYHAKAIALLNRRIYWAKALKSAGRPIQPLFPPLKAELYKLNSELASHLATGVANCTCDPCLDRLYDDDGSDVTVRVDDYWYALLGVHCSSRPSEWKPFSHDKKLVQLTVPPSGGDCVDHPFGFGSSRVPSWMRVLFDLNIMNKEMETPPYPTHHESLAWDSESYTPDWQVNPHRACAMMAGEEPMEIELQCDHCEEILDHICKKYPAITTSEFDSMFDSYLLERFPVDFDPQPLVDCGIKAWDFDPDLIMQVELQSDEVDELLGKEETERTRADFRFEDVCYADSDGHEIQVENQGDTPRKMIVFIDRAYEHDYFPVELNELFDFEFLDPPLTPTAPPPTPTAESYDRVFTLKRAENIVLGDNQLIVDGEVVELQNDDALKVAVDVRKHYPSREVLTKTYRKLEKYVNRTEVVDGESDWDEYFQIIYDMLIKLRVAATVDYLDRNPVQVVFQSDSGNSDHGSSDDSFEITYDSDDSGYRSNYTRVCLQSGHPEKKPEASTFAFKEKSYSSNFEGVSEPIFHTEVDDRHVCDYLNRQEDWCEFESQVVDTLTLPSASSVISRRLGAPSHSKLRAYAKPFTYVTCDWEVKLALRTPLGVAGHYKVCSLDADTAGPFGTALPTLKVSDVMSRDGPIWDLSSQPEFTFKVPYNTVNPVSTPAEVMAGFALANYADLSVPQGVSAPQFATVTVKPVNVKFYVKSEILSDGQPSQTFGVTGAGAGYITPGVAGTVYLTEANLSGAVAGAAVEVFTGPLNAGTLVGPLITTSGTPPSQTIKFVTVSAPQTAAGIYLKVTGLTVPVNAVFVPRYTPTTVNLQSDESVHHVEFQTGEMLGTEETSNVSSTQMNMKENYGDTKSTVEAPTGMASVNVAAERRIYVPIKTVSVSPPTAATDPIFKFKVSPRNFGLTGDKPTYTPSHASLESERYVYYGPRTNGNDSHVCSLKFTSVANAYTNARLMIVAVPPGVPAPTSIAGASQFPRTYHVLHGGETEFHVPWQARLPILYTSGSDEASNIYVYLLENTSVTGQGTPQLTMWVSADGLRYSVPRAPVNFTVLT